MDFKRFIDSEFEKLGNNFRARIEEELKGILENLYENPNIIENTGEVLKVKISLDGVTEDDRGELDSILNEVYLIREFTIDNGSITLNCVRLMESKKYIIGSMSEMLAKIMELELAIPWFERKISESSRGSFQGLLLMYDTRTEDFDLSFVFRISNPSHLSYIEKKISEKYRLKTIKLCYEYNYGGEGAYAKPPTFRYRIALVGDIYTWAKEPEVIQRSYMDKFKNDIQYLLSEMIKDSITGNRIAPTLNYMDANENLVLEFTIPLNELAGNPVSILKYHTFRELEYDIPYLSSIKNNVIDDTLIFIFIKEFRS